MIPSLMVYFTPPTRTISFSSVSLIAPVPYSTFKFFNGFSSTMTYMNDWFFMPLLLFGWIPIIYYMKVNSIPEYFERRFNSTVRNLSTFTMILYLVGYIGIGQGCFY